MIQKRFDDLTSQLEELTGTVRENKEKVGEIDSQVESLRRDIEGVRDQTEADAAALKNDIEESVGDVREDLQGISGELGEISDDLVILKSQIDTLKGIVQYYYLTNKKVPEIDEEILQVLEVPEVRYKMTLKNGTVVLGDILSEDLDKIVMQTILGKLVIEKDFIVSYEERFYTGARVEFEGDYEIREFPEREEFKGRVRNIGERRADFVEVFFYLWDATTKSVGRGSTYVDGTQARFQTGVITDASIEPGGTAEYHIVVPKEPDREVLYRTNEVKWRQYE